MKKCILCETDKEDNEFNKEHVIPKQLGGSLTIENLCKTVIPNSAMKYFMKCHAL